MNILILGSGGREHALAWKIRQSPLCEQLFVAPGNAGTSDVATNLPLNIHDFVAVAKYCLEMNIDMLVVGPEEPLVKGIRDYFATQHPNIVVVGPDKNGAQLEGSKDFSKQFMFRNGIPTAKSFTVTENNLQKGIKYMQNMATPIVLKADGLAAGKGVLICETHGEAESSLHEMITEKQFGEASQTVVIEEFLHGIELSVFVLADGKGGYCILPEAKDYKRIGEGDTGLNTGGMGAVSPVPFADAAFMQKVDERIIKPTIKGILSEGMDYRGFVFIGLMNVDREPLVIEYNCRLGDPETEVVLPRIQNDLVELFLQMHKGELSKTTIQTDPKFCTTVMMVSGGYPGNYEKGKPMCGLNQVNDVLAFHAGTAMAGGEVVTNGGRVLALSAFGETIQDAVGKSLLAADLVGYDGNYFRRDIGQDLI
ncbi:MAG: phosphoribosylamine--glycine ligase [Flavobacteriaceae bacterium]|nr:phosphoribosylamine--glycine ligase [Flavobacteriaceae bacterium]